MDGGQSFVKKPGNAFMVVKPEGMEIENFDNFAKAQMLIFEKYQVEAEATALKFNLKIEIKPILKITSRSQEVP